MSDNFLLTSLWLFPLIGLVIVLFLPKRSEQADQVGVAGLHAADLRRRRSSCWRRLRERAGAAARVAARAGRAQHADRRRRRRSCTGSDESEGQNDLVVRRPWIPYFNIQYYLGSTGSA